MSSRRKMWLISATVAVAVVVGVVLILQFATGTREVPRAVDGDAPERELDDVATEELLDLNAAVDATAAHGSVNLRYRYRIDGEIRQTGVGRMNFEQGRALVGAAGTSQLFTNDAVYLRFGDNTPWTRIPRDDVSSARGEPTPGETNSWAQLELAAQATDAQVAGHTEVSGIPLARIEAIADVQGVRDNIVEDLTGLLDDMAADPDAYEDAFVGAADIEAMLGQAQAHEGSIPIEVWVDADHKIWRVSYDMEDWLPPTDGGGPAATLFALDLRGFGLGGTIELPDEDDVVDPDDLDDPTLPMQGQPGT